MANDNSDREMILHLEKDSSDQPVTYKEITDGNWFGFSSTQGYRSSMEDCHQHLTHLDDHQSDNSFSIEGIGTVRNASDYLRIHLLHQWNQLIEKKNGKDDEHHPKRIRHAIKKAFRRLDKNLREMDYDHSGCVCIACLISPKKIYLINLGDARAIIISKDGEVLSTTHDHKPDDPAENERIYEAGGHITQKSPHDVLRVERRTQVLGDFTLDKNIVSSLPDVIIYSRKLSSSPSYIMLVMVFGM